MSVTSDLGLTRRWLPAAPVMFCREGCAEIAVTAPPGETLAGMAQAHVRRTGHRVTVLSGAQVTWGPAPVPERTYDVRGPATRRGPGDWVARDLTGAQLNELLAGRDDDPVITVHPDHDVTGDRRC